MRWLLVLVLLLSDGKSPPPATGIVEVCGVGCLQATITDYTVWPDLCKLKAVAEYRWYAELDFPPQSNVEVFVDWQAPYQVAFDCEWSGSWRGLDGWVQVPMQLYLPLVIK